MSTVTPFRRKEPSKHQKPKYHHSLAGRVRHSSLFGGQVKLKYVLAEICSFTKVSNSRGIAANAALGNIANVKSKQAGRIKAELIKFGFLTLDKSIGRSHIPPHTLHVAAIEKALEECPGVNFVPLTGTPYPGFKPPLSDKNSKKPPLSDQEAPPVGSEAPPPEGGIIGPIGLITGGRGPRTDDYDPHGSSPDAPALLPLTRQALGLMIKFDSRYGKAFRKALIVGGDFTMDGLEIVATVDGPPNGDVLRECIEKLTAGTDVEVRIDVLNERAPE